MLMRVFEYTTHNVRMLLEPACPVNHGFITTDAGINHPNLPSPICVWKIAGPINVGPALTEQIAVAVCTCFNAALACVHEVTLLQTLFRRDFFLQQQARVQPGGTPTY